MFITPRCHLRREGSSSCSRVEDPIMLMIARKLKKFLKRTHTHTQIQTYADTYSHSHVNLAAAESCQDNFTILQFLQQDQIIAHLYTQFLVYLIPPHTHTHTHTPFYTRYGYTRRVYQDPGVRDGLRDN